MDEDQVNKVKIILGFMKMHQQNAEVQRLGLKDILELVEHSEQWETLIKQLDIISVIVTCMLNHPYDLEVQDSAVFILNLAYSLNRIDHPGSILAIIRALKRFPDNSKFQTNAFRALSCICGEKDSGNASVIIAESVSLLDILISSVKRSLLDMVLCENAMILLTTLIDPNFVGKEVSEANKEFISVKDNVSTILKTMSSHNFHPVTKSIALNLLRQLGIEIQNQENTIV